MSDVETERPFNPDDYPPEMMVGHGRFRLSWWDENRQTLAGIEIWPDNPAESNGDHTAQGYIVMRVDKPRRFAVNGGARHGFRRRCAWCCVVLRGWQLNMCRTCKRAAGSIPLPGQGLGSSPFVHGSRYDAEPDKWRKTK